MDELSEIDIGSGEKSALAFFSAMLNQVKFCVDVFEARKDLESITVHVELRPEYREKHDLDEDVFSFVLQDELLD